MQRRFLAALLVVATAVAGCTTPAEPGDEGLDPTDQPLDGADGGDGNQTRNDTVPLKPPVARIEIFQGQQVYKANFVAENVTVETTVNGGEDVTFLGGDSEAVEKTAKIERWEWDFGDGSRLSGRSVSHAFRDTGGVFRVTLRVVDTHGNSDVQVVTLGVKPTRTFNVTLSFTGSLGPGTFGAGLAPDVAVHPLEIATVHEGFPVELHSLSLLLTPGEPTSDFDLVVRDAEGEVLAASAGKLVGPVPDLGGEEALSFAHGEIAPGVVNLEAILYFGPSGTYTLSGEIVYVVVNPQVEAQFGGAHAH